MSCNHKKAIVAMLISGKIDFKPKNVTRDRGTFYSDKRANLSGRQNS